MVVIDKQGEGARFPVGSPIDIEATAIDPEGYLSRVEFFDGDRSIGVSEIIFIVAPDPGTPIHHQIVWTNATPGEHKLIARAVDSDGSKGESDAVRIFVGEVPDRATLVIDKPEDGARFPAGSPMTIEATAIAPKGSISRGEFF